MIRAIVAGLLAAALVPGAQAHEAYADVVFVNGRVITVDAQDTVATGAAVLGNRIVAVGDVAQWRGPETRVIDLNGRALLPGFIDSHSHVAGMANVEAHFINIQVPPLKDAAAVIARLKQAAAQLPAGAWLIGQGTYNQVMPTRAALDAAFPDNPVRLDWSVHDRLINHKAAQVMGMTRDFPDPPAGFAGRYERDAGGEIVIVRDAPAPWPKDKVFTYPELKEGVRQVLTDFYLKRGVTTVSDMSDASTYHAYQDLRDEGRLPTRVRINYIYRSPDPLLGTLDVDTLLAAGIKTGLGDDWIRVGALKIILDGVWGTTAAVYKPFWNGSGTTWAPGLVGNTTLKQDQLNAIVTRFHAAGWQIQAHANGDRAQDMLLTAYEAAQAAYPRADARDRIEHFGHFLVQDPARTAGRLKRVVDDHVIVSPQVAFLWRLTDVNVKEPDMQFFPLRRLIDLGLHPAGGVDTVGTQNFATYPLFSIQRAVVRDTKYGTRVQPDQAISVIEGIRMFTIWAAEANFLEKKLGSIEVGKLADFVVLGADPLAVDPRKLSEIPVDMTVIDGKVVYTRTP